MSEDWKPGDLAVCMKDEWQGMVRGMPPAGNAPVQGRIYKVLATFTSLGIVWLGLEGFPSEKGWDSESFRKVRPDQHEPCEVEFITLLNRTKRKVSA